MQGDRGEGKKAKLFIVLKKHANFDENMKKFNQIREENDKLQKLKEEAAGVQETKK